MAATHSGRRSVGVDAARSCLRVSGRSHERSDTDGQIAKTLVEHADFGGVLAALQATAHLGHGDTH